MDEYDVNSPPRSPKIRKKEKIHKCNVSGCNAVFYRPYRLELHLKKHLGEKPFVCNVPGCSKSYTNASHLRRHKTTSHEDQKVEQEFLCSVEGCGLVLGNKYSLQKHMIRYHKKTSFPFKCSKCSERFKKKKHLNQHFFVTHEEAPYKCESCDISFVSRKLFSKHQGNHKVYTCDCEQTFDRWSELLKHRKTDCHLKVTVHTCVICNKAYTLKRNLAFHVLKTHVEESRRELYRCPYVGCTRSYQYGKNLNYHIKSFHGEIDEQIKCTEPNCDQVFKKKRYLQRHLEKVHKTTKKPKKPRRPRKDKGKRKKCMAAILTGTKLTPAEHLKIINQQFSNATTSLNPPEEACNKFLDNLVHLTALKLSIPDSNTSERDHVSSSLDTGRINGSISLPILEKNELEKQKALFIILKRENIAKVGKNTEKLDSFASAKANNSYDKILLANEVDCTVVPSKEGTHIEQIVDDVLILPLDLDNQDRLDIRATEDLPEGTILESNPELVKGDSLITQDFPGNTSHSCTTEPVAVTMETEVTENAVWDKGEDEQLLDIKILSSDTMLLEKCDEILRKFNSQEQNCFI